MEVLYFWAIMGGIGSYWVAKQKGFSIPLWTVLGVAIGPIALIILAFKKKSSAPSKDQSLTDQKDQSLTDQAVERIRTVRYSVDNAASKIGGTDAFKSGSRIANEIRGIFKKR